MNTNTIRDAQSGRGFIRASLLLSALTLVQVSFAGAPEKAAPQPMGSKCEDQKTVDGNPYTAWCQKNVVGKPKTAPLNCWVPVMQARCLKSCGLCKP